MANARIAIVPFMRKAGSVIYTVKVQCDEAYTQDELLEACERARHDLSATYSRLVDGHDEGERQQVRAQMATLDWYIDRETLEDVNVRVVLTEENGGRYSIKLETKRKKFPYKSNELFKIDGYIALMREQERIKGRQDVADRERDRMLLAIEDYVYGGDDYSDDERAEASDEWHSRLEWRDARRRERGQLGVYEAEIMEHFMRGEARP